MVSSERFMRQSSYASARREQNFQRALRRSGRTARKYNRQLRTGRRYYDSGRALNALDKRSAALEALYKKKGVSPMQTKKGKNYAALLRRNRAAIVSNARWKANQGSGGNPNTPPVSGGRSGRGRGTGSSTGSAKSATTTPATTIPAGSNVGPTPWAGAGGYVGPTAEYNAARDAIRSAFAERGLLDSSMFGSAMSQAADVDARRRFQEQEQVRQYNMGIAARWYEMLRAGLLQEAQIRGGFDNLSSGYPNQPSYLGSLQSNPYYGIGYSPNQNTMGDPTSQPWTSFKPAGGPTLQRVQLDAQTAANNARIALQKRALELEERKWNEQQKQLESDEDIWNEMMTVAIGNQQIRENPQTGEIERYGVLEPSSILAGFKARGYDIEKMVQGNPNDPTVSRARAVYSILYPKSAKNKFKVFDTTQDWEQAKKNWKTLGAVGAVPGEESGLRSRAGRAMVAWGPARIGPTVSARFQSIFGKTGESYDTLMNKYWKQELKRLEKEWKARGIKEKPTFEDIFRNR